jgi:hypothetical protein
MKGYKEIKEKARGNFGSFQWRENCLREESNFSGKFPFSTFKCLKLVNTFFFFFIQIYAYILPNYAQFCFKSFIGNKVSTVLLLVLQTSVTIRKLSKKIPLHFP